MKVLVNTQQIKIIDDSLFVTNTRGVYTVKFEIGDDLYNIWDKATNIVACFRKKCSDTIYSVILDENLECDIPGEVLNDESGFYLGLLGSSSEFDYPTIWSRCLRPIYGTKNGEFPPEPTPSIWTQIIELVERAEEAAEEANERAQLVENLTVDADTLEYLEPAEADVSIVDDHYHIQFGIPKGRAGASAGFGTPTATVDQSTGTPRVVISASGPDTAKVFSFAFSGIKGEPGDSDGDMHSSDYDPDGTVAEVGIPSYVSNEVDEEKERALDAESELYFSKQPVIDDLEDIRQGASLGKTALQTVPSTYRTSAEQDLIDKEKQDKIDDLNEIRSGANLGSTSIQPNDNISELNNDSGYITGITSSDVTTALGYTPYNATNPSGYQNSDDVDSKISAHNTNNSAHADIRNAIPDVINNVTSTAIDDALSAHQGKLLNDRINNIAGRGRFLSLWNCATGLPLTNPSGYPYEYHTGDFFIVNNTGATNYIPNGSTYTGVPSTTVYSGSIKVNDTIFYDGTSWLVFDTPAGTGNVQDVYQNGVSVLSEGIAYVVVPTNVSDLINDSLFQTPSDVQNTVSGAINTHNSSTTAHDDIRQLANGKYTKPSGGIPKTDLASAVQTSLGLADTALQNFTETDPTVPSWAKQSTKPSYNASEVGALPSDQAFATVNGTSVKGDNAISVQPTLVSGTNIKTLNGGSILGAGNLDITGVKIDPETTVDGDVWIDTTEQGANEVLTELGGISFKVAQTLTDAQKAQARANIGILIWNGSYSEVNA